MTERFDLADFEDALDRHGAQLQRWPESLRAQAKALLEASAAARARHAAVAALDEVWSAPPPASAALRVAILAGAQRRRESLPALLWRALGGFRLVGPAFATALLVGIALGRAAPLEPGEALGDEFATIAGLDEPAELPGERE